MVSLLLTSQILLSSPITNAAALAEAAYARETVGMRFDLQATITHPFDRVRGTFAVADRSGISVLKASKSLRDTKRVRAGDVVRLNGETREVMSSVSDDVSAVYAEVDALDIIWHTNAPPPVCASFEQIISGKAEGLTVRVEATVREFFVDEIDPKWLYLGLQSGRDIVYAVFPTENAGTNRVERLVGADVSAVGLCHESSLDFRRLMGRTIYLTGPEAITETRPAPADPFDVPKIGSSPKMRRALLEGFNRRRASGRVVAAWKPGHFLLRTDDGSIVGVTSATGDAPRYGISVEAAGRVETDLFRVNLESAVWRVVCGTPIPPEEPEAISAAYLLTDGAGRRNMKSHYNGKAIRIRGRVRTIPRPPDGDAVKFFIDDSGTEVAVDASACPEAMSGLEEACTADISGTCLMETGNWYPGAPFPHVGTFSIVIRTPGDVMVVSRPPWWTAGRLAAAICALLATLVGILVWNTLLRRTSERRGQALAEEKIARMESELKTIERTKLAVELHDSLSQTLTGVSFELEAAGEMASGTPADLRHHIDIATRALDSCRIELRNCLWDLRSRVLDESDVKKAIEKTVGRVIGKATLALEFDAPRERLSENTMHTLLRIVRELATNAVRHGNARTVSIRGSAGSDMVRLTVLDDGSGFDAANCPGVSSGHFGLQGIRERVEALCGEMSIDSSAGKGTRVDISFRNCQGEDR